MKSVILLVEGQKEHLKFETVKEAQDFAARFELSSKEKFAIYTLYMQGERAQIDWKLETDTATNLRENKKKKEKVRKGKWSSLELEALKKAHEKGLTIKSIAEVLKRSYNSVYIKVRDLEEKKKAIASSYPIKK